jgi:hypothetical protein
MTTTAPGTKVMIMMMGNAAAPNIVGGMVMMGIVMIASVESIGMTRTTTVNDQGVVILPNLKTIKVEGDVVVRNESDERNRKAVVESGKSRLENTAKKATRTKRSESIIRRLRTMTRAAVAVPLLPRMKVQQVVVERNPR